MPTGCKIVLAVTNQKYKDAGLWSAMSNCGKDGTVRYQTSKAVRPNEGCGPLSVFSDVKSARNWGLPLCCELYECEFEPSTEEHLYTKNNRSQMHISECPSGTVLAKWVKLTKNIS